MTDTAFQRILLATDFSPRCDRALDRAVQLARERGAHLTVMTVVQPEPAGAPGGLWSQARGDAHRLAERQLREDADAADLPIDTRIALGPVAERILDVALLAGSDLVVTGVARDELLGRLVLGSAVDALVARSPVPVLIVRHRPRAGYRDLLVSTDFSAASAAVLAQAARLFPQAGLTLFHAFGNPYPVLAGMDAASAQAEGHRRAQAEAEAFVAGASLPDGVRERIRLRLAFGDAALLLRQRAQERPGELLVVGTQGRSALVQALLGSQAQRIIGQSAADTLVLPGGRRR